MCSSLDRNTSLKATRKTFKDPNRRSDRLKFVISKTAGNFRSDFWGSLYVVKSRAEFAIIMILAKMNPAAAKLDQYALSTIIVR